jgi:hypothetical protein
VFGLCNQALAGSMAWLAGKRDLSCPP